MLLLHYLLHLLQASIYFIFGKDQEEEQQQLQSHLSTLGHSDKKFQFVPLFVLRLFYLVLLAGLLCGPS